MIIFISVTRDNMKPIDIFITAYQRPGYTFRTLQYLFERTTYPHRIFLIDNGGNEGFEGSKLIDHYIKLSGNFGLSPAWNVALALAESEYFITSDNDIYVPDLKPDWLTQLVTFMDERLDYGAISLHPHVFIGAAGIDPNDLEDVKERNMCGGVMRLMRRDAVWKAGGWERDIKIGRGSEERTICSRLQSNGYKVGICSRIRAFHPFGSDIEGNLGWGYSDLTPEQQGHNPQLKDEVLRFDNPDAYDPLTWLPL